MRDNLLPEGVNTTDAIHLLDSSGQLLDYIMANDNKATKFCHCVPLTLKARFEMQQPTLC